MSDATRPDEASRNQGFNWEHVLREPARQRELRQIVEGLADSRAAHLATVRAPEHVAQLQALYRGLSERHTFEPAQLVEWKPGLKNRSHPAYGQPMVVVEVLAEPVLARPDNSGSPYFREPLTIIAGGIDEDGDFMLWHYDARRLRPYGGS